MKNKVSRWLIVISVFFIAFASAGSTFAAPSFDNLKGSAHKGKVKISVESFQEKDGALKKVKGVVRIKEGSDTSYIPIITNKGDECNLRLRIYARNGEKKINIVKYCYGFEGSWIRKDGWFYYKKAFEKNESTQICSGFHFPAEWKAKECNLLSITVDAEAVADEDLPNDNNKGSDSFHTPKTGDDSKLPLYLIALILSLIGILITRRKKNGGEDI